MTDPHRLSDVDLLVWAVILRYRERLRARRNQHILPSYPPCPTCGADVSRVDFQEVFETSNCWLVMQLCGHDYAVDGDQVDRIQRHVSDLLWDLSQADAGQLLRASWLPDGRSWTTDDLAREARARLGQPAATEATDALPLRRLESRAVTAALTAMQAQGEWLPMPAVEAMAKAVVAEITGDQHQPGEQP
ncbi:hypothetical protein [Streptomyces sp. NPDC057293]|uniref:hypothetical protein n=1 Tax=unclassified Streptomyces TaxID=2593676 RepID=UPI0036398E2C